MNFSLPFLVKLYYVYVRTCAYQEVRNDIFLENFAWILKKMIPNFESQDSTNNAFMRIFRRCQESYFFGNLRTTNFMFTESRSINVILFKFFSNICTSFLYISSDFDLYVCNLYYGTK